MEYDIMQLEDGRWQLGQIERLPSGANNYALIGIYDQKPDLATLPPFPPTDADRLAALEAAVLDLMLGG